MAKLEILMIHRNRPKYFEKAKESLENQTFKDFKVKYFENKMNESLSDITTRWFLDSDCELVGKIDDDLLLEKDCLERLVEAHSAFHFGFLGPFHFREEEMKGVEPKITEYNGIKIWERAHIGGNFVIRREDFEPYKGEGTHGLSDFQWEFRKKGLVNGYIYPFSIADHMQDARSRHHVPEYFNKFGMDSKTYLDSFIRDSIPYLKREETYYE